MLVVLRFGDDGQLVDMRSDGNGADAAALLGEWAWRLVKGAMQESAQANADAMRRPFHVVPGWAE